MKPVQQPPPKSPRESWGIALHGGAGVHDGRDYSRAERMLADLVQSSGEWLAGGASAVDVVEDAVAAMEASGLFVAGRGSAANGSGQVELDATIMDGFSGRAGSVAAMQGIAQPIRTARRVMDATPHVLLAGDGASKFAKDQGLAEIGDLSLWLTTPDGFEPDDLDEGHGTVGAVALDITGRLAAATSTGGTYGASCGRVGDSAVVGAGAWADHRVAVSCTGQGEAFIKSVAAYDVAARLRYAQATLPEAAAAVLDVVARHDGDGGLIAILATGEIVMPFNSPGMKRACMSSSLSARVGSVGTTLKAV